MNLRTKVMQHASGGWVAEYLSGLKYGTIKDNNTDCAKTLVICSDDWDCVCWLAGCFQNKFIPPLPGSLPIIPPYTQANTNEKSPAAGFICPQSQIKNCEEVFLMNSCTYSSGCELLVKLSTSSFSQTSSCCCDSSWLKLLLQQLKLQKYN